MEDPILFYSYIISIFIMCGASVFGMIEAKNMDDFKFACGCFVLGLSPLSVFIVFAVLLYTFIAVIYRIPEILYTLKRNV